MVTPPTAGPTTGPRGMALGITATAGLILMLVGVFGMIQGLVGLIDNDIYVVTNKWLFELTPTIWGWGHIVIGLIALCAGHRPVPGQGLGAGHRHHRRRVQHPGQLRLAAPLPGLGAAGHHLRRVRHLGGHRPRQRLPHHLIYQHAVMGVRRPG